MPISFSCSQCGKGYLVSDVLAGKKAVCKACNNRMTIPGGAAPAPTPAPVARVRPTSAPSPGPAAARPGSSEPTTSYPSAIPTAKVISRGPEPPGDIYGLDEAPTAPPRMTPRTPVADATVAEAPARTKKKKKGFFSSGKKTSASARSFSYSGGGIGGLRLIGILVAVGVAIAGGIGLVPKSGVRDIHAKAIQLKQELLGSLVAVRDAPTARAMSPKVQGILDRIYKHMEDNKDKKANQADIDAVVREFEAQDRAIEHQLTAEIGRISRVPGAIQALNIEGHINRLSALESQIKK